MNRRDALKSAAILALSSAWNSFAASSRKTHYLTLSFDDGFKKSFYKTAQLHEEFGLHACLNVIASGHFPGFPTLDEYMPPKLFGDFDDWNALKARGHEVMPHTWDHRDLTKVSLSAAEDLIVRCLAYFTEHLHGFVAKESVFNFAYNFSTPALDRLALSKCRAVRTQGDTPINPLPRPITPVRLGCYSQGPANSDNFVEEQVNGFLKSSGGWMILNVHGLDEEGWGPLSSVYLRSLLQRLVSVSYLEMVPTGMLLHRIDQLSKKADRPA